MLLFVLIGGVFVGTEIALVSLRESQIRARNPNRFLSAVEGPPVADSLDGGPSTDHPGPTVPTR